VQVDAISKPNASKLRGLLRLTRWTEFVPYVFPLTTFGALMATKATGTAIDGRLIVAILANLLVGAYAFMINDIEDAPDDAFDPARAARNPVAAGEISAREGWLATLACGALALVLFALLGLPVLLTGGLNLVLAHLYSWKIIRLKAYPVADVVSHALMLSGLVFLIGYFTFHNQPGAVWWIVLSMTLVSCYGQLYNQVRDFEADKAAGLHNTAILIGERAAHLLGYAFVGAAVVILIGVFISGLIPWWVLIAPLAALPLFLIIRPQRDMRGGEAANLSGKMQWATMLLYNLAIGVWFIAALLKLW